MYNSTEGCTNFLGSGIRISFRQEMLYQCDLGKLRPFVHAKDICQESKVLVKTFQKQLIHGAQRTASSSSSQAHTQSLNEQL